MRHGTRNISQHQHWACAKDAACCSAQRCTAAEPLASHYLLFAAEEFPQDDALRVPGIQGLALFANVETSAFGIGTLLWPILPRALTESIPYIGTLQEHSLQTSTT
eukprot:jgi/Mesvir1/2069/Mv26086-RA.1